jgi:pyruvate formate lyase activating enzyme
MVCPAYGRVSAMARDPIEKKPLYHYRPGSEILSIGFLGCNLRCPFCQNSHISQISADAMVSSRGGSCFPPEAAAQAVKDGASRIAYTYSEPLIHAEYLLDCMKAVREAGGANVLVTNGCVNREAAGAILALTDAANIDLKSFSAETYAKILGGNLETVLDFIRLACRMKVHTELTTLVVTGLNDSREELDACASFIGKLRPGPGGLGTVPWHLSAYHPDYQWDAPPTDPALLLETAGRAKKSVRFVYTGNIPGEENDTLCPECGNTLIKRRGYRVDTGGLVLKKTDGVPAYYCAHCEKPAPVRY